ncbi:hypothetical protein ACQY0O_001198 [Thecaphora frezii]
MVYVSDWNEFQQRCIRLYQQSPERARYLIKARPSTHQLTLKVTDDVTTLKYRTRSSVILGRFELFNKAMMAAMSGAPKPHTLLAPTSDEPGAQANPQTQTSSTAAQQPAPAAATPTATGAAKKKKKKGKK